MLLASPFGQQAPIFERDKKRVGRLVDALVPQVSRIWLNSQCEQGPDAFPSPAAKASAEHAVNDGRSAGLQHPHHGRGATTTTRTAARVVHRPATARTVSFPTHFLF